MTHTEAAILARKVRVYWAKRGHVVTTSIVQEPWRRGVGIPGHGIRTDMKNGLPADSQNKNPGVPPIGELANGK